MYYYVLFPDSAQKPPRLWELTQFEFITSSSASHTISLYFSTDFIQPCIADNDYIYIQNHKLFVNTYPSDHIIFCVELINDWIEKPCDIIF